MAVQDCDKISNIVAVAIAAGDDDLAKDIAQLSAVKNDAIQRSRKLRETGEAIDVVTGYTPHELELRASSADIQIRAIVQSKILDGSKGAEAQMELARQIKKTGGSMAGGANLLEMVSKAPIADYEEIAKLWDDTMNVSEAMADLNKGLSDFVSSNYSIRKYSDFYEGEVSKAKNKLKDKKITQEEYEKEISEAHDKAMKKIAKGENPSGFIPLDNEWQAIKKVFGDNPKEAGKKWSQYVMARELLADGGLDDNLIKAFNFGGEKLTGDLTIRQINECEDLDVLLSRAFTNTEQLYTDGELREAYRSRLAQLASGKTLTEKNERKIRTLVNVSLFAEEGATLSNILLDNRAYLSVRQMGFKTSERNGGKIYDGLRSFARKLADGKDEDILNGTIKIGGLEMQPKHIVQLIYDITGDKNILALMNAGNFSDTAILDVATQRLLGDNEKAKASLIKLFQKGKEGNKITNTRGVFLRAVTGLDVPDGAKVGFFDYRKGLYYKDELSSTKADFYDKLAEKNKIRIKSEGIQDLTDEAQYNKDNVKALADRLKKGIGGGFLIVNDDGYKDNPLLRDALNLLKGEDEVTVLFPRGGAMAGFSIEDGNVFYKTINDGLFDRVVGTISIQSMGEAKPTPEILSSAYEAQLGRDGKMVEIKAAMERGEKDDFFYKGEGYINVTKPSKELRETDGYATLYNIIKNRWYDGNLSILSGKLKTDGKSIKEAYKKYKSIKITKGGEQTIKMYRASGTSVDKIVYGDYITPSREYAGFINDSIYGGTATIIEEEIPINKIWLRKDKSIEEGCFFYSEGEIDKAVKDVGKSVNMDAAMVIYNSELNDAAVKYFGTLLGAGTDVVDAAYTEKVQTLLSDMLGIDIDAFNTFTDKSRLWQRIDKQLSLERLTAGRFDREIIDVGKERQRIYNLSDEDLAKEINDKFGVLVRGGTIVGNENLPIIKEAWFNYNRATNIDDLLSAEGSIISLVNGTQGTKVSIDDLKTMFQNKTFKEKYKEMFFPNQDLTDEDWKLFIDQINSDLFDGLSIQFSENLVKAGYSLPLINTKKVVYDYLNGKLDLNSDFVQAFFYKNNIPFTRDDLNAVMDTMMPKEFKFDFATYTAALEDENIAGDISRVIESKNRFLPDSYSALVAIEDSGKGITLGNKETAVLESMLNKYIDEVLGGMSKGTLKFDGAQKLKQELSYALDTFEQDFILPKYGAFLTPQDKQVIFGIKYDIPIGVSGQPYNRVENMLRDTKDRIMSNYRRVLGTMVSNNDVNEAIAKGYNADITPDDIQKRIENRRNQLISNGSTIKEINGDYVVYSVKDALRETIDTLPSNIQGVAGLRAIGREGIEGLTNKQAYILLRYLEATKSLATTANYATQLMYKQTPQLAQYSFFSTYVIDETTGLPKIMASNSLAADTFFDNKLSSVAVDQAIKEEIFEKVVNKFRKDGYILANTVKKGGKIVEKGLDDIISEVVNRQLDDIHSIKFAPDEIETAKSKMQNIYTNMFIPYTYLRDIPSGGTTKAGTKLIDVKEKVTSTMRAAYTQAKKDLEDAGATNADKIQQAIAVKLDDGQVMDLDSLAKLDVDSWKEQIFNDKSIAIRSADVDATFEAEDYKNIFISDKTAERRAEKAEKNYRESVQNEYLSSLQAILNDGQIISDGERSMMTSFMLDVRTDLRKYTLTSKLVDALDSLSGINEEVARGIKNYLIGFGGVVSFGKFFSGDILRRLELVKDAYKGYYGMSLDQLMKTLPKTQAEEVAWNTARYFKNLERLLGSVDGKTGVTTSERVNKAFYHLGETFLNLNTETNGRSVRGIFSMLSAIEQNQVLKFFKFSNSGQQSYVKEFVQGAARDGKDSIWDGLRGYKDYVQDITNINREQFNILFGTSYGDNQFKRVLQGLTGFTLASGTAYRKFNQFLDLLNSSWTALRMVMSYPGQLLTVPLQGVAYFLKQVGYELKLGIESISDIDDIRETFGILDGAYNELNILGKLNFNPDSKDISSFYNRYGIPDIKEALKGTNISTADDFVNMYAKIDTKYSKPGWIQRAVKWFDPYKDNANNFIDGIFARNFKNIAFVKGLKDNNFMKFSDASSFLEFMNNPEINNEIKSRLLDAVAAASGRNFRNILGLGFGGLDRAVGGAEWQTILFGLMQMFNFRGSWGQNIFKQTGTNLMHMLRWLGSNVGLSKASKDEVAKFIAYSPEFNNFITAFLTDMEWAFKLTRYQDNGRWPDEDEDGIHYFLDYLSFFGENMNMVSQRWQGIQSFGPVRPFLEQRESMLRTQMDPTVYHDTYGLGAFFNAFGKNFLRQWKPVNWIAELIGAFEEGGPANARAYFNNKVLNLSFGTIRYMVNEDMNGYGYTYEVTGQYGGIPGVVMGEAQFGSDKSFMYELDNDETWSNLQLYFGDDLPWSERKVYGKNLWKSFVNGSQFASALKNLWKISPWGEYTKSFFTADDLSNVYQKTSAGKEFYSKGYVTPETIDEANTFFKTILHHSEYRPGSSNFNKSIMQFEDLGHMDAAKGNAADADMELRLEHMKYQTNENGEFVKKDGKKVIDPSWTDLMTNIKTYGGNEEYVTKTIYDYSKAWLDVHSSDPNYPLYLHLLGQGNAHMLIETEMNKRLAELNPKGTKKEDKWSEADFNKFKYREMLLEMGNSVLPGDNMTFFDRLNRLDEDSATLAAIQIIDSQSSEEDRKIIEKFYTVEMEDDGETVKSMSLKPQYESVLKQIGRIGRAMDEGNVDRVVAQSSTLMNMYKDNDPAGIITANTITSLFNRIYDARNLSPELKQEMMMGVFYSNKEFAQRNPEELRELLGDNYDHFTDLMNEMIYQWDGQVISNMESIITSGNEDTASKSKAISGAKQLSSAFKKLSMNYGSKGGGTARAGNKAGQGYGERVPVKIKGADLVKQLGLKGYSPVNPAKTVFAYKPHTDLSLAKDVNRQVKGPTTETVSSKKQLSDIEKKTTKALEAES